VGGEWSVETRTEARLAFRVVKDVP
jgi:hypothetical protein